MVSELFNAYFVYHIHVTLYNNNVDEFAPHFSYWLKCIKLEKLNFLKGTSQRLTVHPAPTKAMISHSRWPFPCILHHDAVVLHCSTIKMASILDLLVQQRSRVLHLPGTFIKVVAENYGGENNRRWPTTWRRWRRRRLEPVPLLCVRWFTMLTVQHVNVTFGNGLSVHYAGTYCRSSVYLDAIDRALLIYGQFSHHLQTLHPLKIHDCYSTACTTRWRNHFRAS